MQDGIGYRDLMSKTLDNVVVSKRVPVMAAVVINSGRGDSKVSQRGLEYDTVSGLYAESVEKEVLPEISKRWQVKLTADPEGRATMGGSSGAAVAFTMASFHP